MRVNKAMFYILKHLKGVAIFLATLVLLQSCIVYKKNSSTVEEATSEEEMPIKIITKYGIEYKLRWIEEKDGNILSIKNVERQYYCKEDIFQYVILDPNPHTVPLNQAVNHNGIVRILVTDINGNHISHEFINIREIDERIIGYKLTGKETTRVIIPIDQIEKIQLKDKEKSFGRTIGLMTGLVIGVGIIILIASMAYACADGACSWWS